MWRLRAQGASAFLSARLWVFEPIAGRLTTCSLLTRFVAVLKRHKRFRIALTEGARGKGVPLLGVSGRENWRVEILKTPG